MMSSPNEDRTETVRSFWENSYVKKSIAIIGLLGSLLSIWGIFFQEKTEALQFEIIANTNVLDIKADISKLDINYGGTSLKQNHENLRIITIRVINNGTASILKNYFDEKEPLGFSVSQGTIIERPQILETSNSYIQKNLSINIDSTNRISFGSIILEPKDYFVVKVLVLHSLEVVPTITPKGKIAGINTIQLINKNDQNINSPFWVEVFYGSPLVQLARSLSYAIIFLVTISIGISIIVMSNTRINKYRRSKVIRKFKSTSDYKHNKMNDAIFDRYKKGEIHFLQEINSFIKDDKLLIKYIKNKNVIDDESKVPLEDNALQGWLRVYNACIEDGFIIIEGKGFEINHVMASVLSDFLQYEKMNGLESDKYKRIEVSELRVNGKIISAQNYQE